jgi:hypothetical protein
MRFLCLRFFLFHCHNCGDGVLRKENFFSTISFIVLVVDLNPNESARCGVYFRHSEDEIFGLFNELNCPFGAR